MANRLLPFRQYNEHFVVNLFALKTSELDLTSISVNTHAASGKHDAGVLVKPTQGILDLGAGYSGSGEDAGKGDSTLNTYLGSTGYPHVGRNVNPEAFGKIEVAGVTDTILGVTLNQTLAYDENGEKMLYYRQKLLEHQGVLPGEAVPVLTKGIITVSTKGITGSAPTIGDPVFAGLGGKFTKDTEGDTATQVGICIGRGNREGVYDSESADYFAGDGSTGGYYIIKIDL
jgi:hypothetical protein